MLASNSTATTTVFGAQDRLFAGTIAALLGVFMLFGVGFAHSDILHNAAHDTRHAITVPCH